MNYFILKKHFCQLMHNIYCFIHIRRGTKWTKKRSSNDVRKYKKNYQLKDKRIDVLSCVNIKFYNSNFYAIKGESGSRKSTLVNTLGW